MRPTSLRGLVLCALCLAVPISAQEVAPAAGASDPQPATPLAAAPDLPALLARVGARMDALEAAQHRSRYLEVSDIEQLDGDGEVKTRSRSVVRVTWKDGKQQRHIVRFTEEGEDLTEEKRAEQKERKGRGLGSPLTTEGLARHRVTVVGPAGEGRLTLRFEPAGDPEQASRGTAVVDPATGRVLSLRLSPAKLPALVDRVDASVTFAAETPHGPMPSRMVLHIEAGLPFFKKRYRIRTTLSEYAWP